MIPRARHLLRALPALLCLLLPSIFPPRAEIAPVRVTGIRFWTNENYTRVAVDLTGDAAFRTGFLRADPARKLPARVFVDIAGSDVREEILRRPVTVGNGLLKLVRAGRYRKDVVRVVVDLERESTFRTFTLPDPARIIIDIEGRAESPAAAVSGTPGGETRPGDAGVPSGAEVPVVAGGDNMAPPRPASSPAPRGRIRVMIDPGHGGKDPGACGPTGLKEKDVVLALGRLVRERLLASGEYEVLATRDSDVFLELPERTAMANTARAHIFVSLHINASPNRRAQGISTYVLSRATDRQALELAARENGVPVQKLTEFEEILKDLSFYPRKNESMRLGKTVNDAIVKSVKSRFGPVHDLGLRQAPFYVLLGAQMTAILVEASFITNPHEERRLRKTEYLETIADSIVEAIRYYGARSLAAGSGLGA